MTSDRSNSGSTDLDLTTKPVSPKSPGLNPNANEFLSSKSPATPNTSPKEWDNVAADNAVLPNGDVKTEVSGALPQVESPLPAPAADLAIVGEVQDAAYGSDSTPVSNEEVAPPYEGSFQEEEQLRPLLRNQLEYYFSRENLVRDSYLISQMDADQYVSIATIAGFNQIKKFTNNLDLIVDILRESSMVQVDEKGEKVRPNHSRCVVILREIPDSTPVEEVKGLFKGENCPPVQSCEFAHNGSWYVTFESDEDAQTAFFFLRNEVKTFLGRPIMARIKAKPLVSRFQQPTTYVQRNGIKMNFDQQPYAQVPQPTYQPQVVPRMPFVNNQQQYPTLFQYTTAPPVMANWGTHATATPAFLDPGANLQMLAMNGYQATSIKPSTATGRHMYPSNMRQRNSKQHRQPNLERSNSESRTMGDRNQMPPRASPRSVDNIPMASHSFPRRGDNSQNHGLNMHGPLPNFEANANLAMGAKNDQVSLQRKGYRRGRRPDDGAKTSRMNSSQQTKDGRGMEPQFELESTSFPPLPGAANNNNTSSETFESSKMSHVDVVRGTAKSHVRDMKTQTAPSAVTPTPTPQPPKDTPEPTAVPVTTATTTVVTAEPVVHPKSSKATSTSDSPKPVTEPPVQAVVSSQSKPNTDDEKPVKPSYAQMLLRKNPENATAAAAAAVSEKAKPASNDQQPQTPAASVSTSAVASCAANSVRAASNPGSQTLREQSQAQTVRVQGTASARSPIKDLPTASASALKDEPKEQRPPTARRAKENRERRRRDREPGREPPRVR